MSTKRCCVTGCGNGESLRFFPHPKRRNKMFWTWVHTIGGEFLNENYSEVFIYNNRRVCSKHFDLNDIYANNRLSQDAVPTKYLTETETDAEPSTSLQKIINQPSNECNQEPFQTEDSVQEALVDDNQCEEAEEPMRPFSWQQPSAMVPDDAETLEDDGAEGVSLWSEESARDTPKGRQRATQAAYHCNACLLPINGFRYACVQCADFDLCGACEGAGRHPTHYELRVPPDKTKYEVAAVLQTIRRAITNCIVDFDDHVITLKEEIHDLQYEDPIAEGSNSMDAPGIDGSVTVANAGSNGPHILQPKIRSYCSLTTEEVLDIWDTEGTDKDENKLKLTSSHGVAFSKPERLSAEGTKTASSKAQTVDSNLILRLGTAEPSQSTVSTPKTVQAQYQERNKKILKLQQKYKTIQGAKIVTIPTCVTNKILQLQKSNNNIQKLQEKHNSTEGAKIVSRPVQITSVETLKLPKLCDETTIAKVVTLPKMGVNTDGAKIALPTTVLNTSGAKVVTLPTTGINGAKVVKLPTTGINGAKRTLPTTGLITSGAKVVKLPTTGINGAKMTLPTMGINGAKRTLPTTGINTSGANTVTLPTMDINTSDANTVTLPTMDINTSDANTVTLPTMDINTSGANTVTLPKTGINNSGANTVTFSPISHTSATNIVTLPTLVVNTIGARIITLPFRLNASDSRIETPPSKYINSGASKRQMSTTVDASSEPASKKNKDAVLRSTRSPRGVNVSNMLQTIYARKATVRIQRLTEEEIKSALHKR